MDTYQIAISTGFGLEAVTKRELYSLCHIDAPAQHGLLRFQGTQADIVNCNLWLRTAERVYIVVGEAQSVTSFDDLFEAVTALPWAQYLPMDADLHVAAKSVNSALYALSACQSVAHKAIAVNLCKAYHLDALPQTGARYDVTINLYADHLCVLLDTSGQGLHRRGYRTLVGEAALTETMAAAIVLLSVYHADKTLIDPFCGSGTIPIEAALIARNIAPGLNRPFAYEQWPTFDQQLATDRRIAAAQAANTTRPLRISGFDIDPKAIDLCRYHARRAEVADTIHFQCMDMRNVSSHDRYGVIITNPPYGERLLDEKQVGILMRDFAGVFRALPDWSAYIITAYAFLERDFKRKADKNRKLYNGTIECRLYQYMGAKPPKKEN